MFGIREEQDEEVVEWEYEQLRRGGLRTPEPETKIKPVYKPTPSTYPSHHKLLRTHSILLVPPVTPVPSLGPAIYRLSARLTLLTSSHVAQSSATIESLARERSNGSESGRKESMVQRL